MSWCRETNDIGQNLHQKAETANKNALQIPRAGNDIEVLVQIQKIRFGNFFLFLFILSTRKINGYQQIEIKV